MAGDISKKLDAKVKQMAIGDTLGNIIVTSKKLRDQLNKKDPVKAKAGLKTGGRASLKIGGPGQQARKKKEKTLGQKQFETYMAEKDTGFKKAQRIQKTYEGASPKIKADLEKRFKNVFNPKEMVVSSRRDTAKVQNMAKGGRAGFKSGSKGCKLAMKGKGRAYGKNS